MDLISVSPKLVKHATKSFFFCLKVKFQILAQL